VGHLTLACIQFSSRPFATEQNLNRAEKLIEEAHRRGAAVVVLPELFNTGYVEHERLHRLAEACDGATVLKLKAISRKLGVYVAAGFVERFQRHVYDSLAFSTPTGDVAIYRKRHLIFWEHSYFRPGNEPLVVQTSIGRIGFAICADMLHADIWRDYRGRIDLAVIAAAWPRACPGMGRRAGWLLRPSEQLAEDVPRAIARTLGVPVAFANHCGACEVRVPMMGPSCPAQFAGRSAILDAAGGRKSSSIDGEGLVIGSIETGQEHISCGTLSA